MNWISRTAVVICATAVGATQSFAASQQDQNFEVVRKSVVDLAKKHAFADAFKLVSSEYRIAREQIAKTLDNLSDAQLSERNKVNAELNSAAKRLKALWELGLNVCVADQDRRFGGTNSICEDDKVLWVVNGKAVGRQLLGSYHFYGMTAQDKRPKIPEEVTMEALVSSLQPCGVTNRQDVAEGTALIVIAEFTADTGVLGSPPDATAGGSKAKGEAPPDSFVAAVVASDGKHKHRFVPLSILRSSREAGQTRPEINKVVTEFGETVDRMATQGGFTALKSLNLGFGQDPSDPKSRFHEKLQAIRAATLDVIAGDGSPNADAAFPLYKYGTWIVAPAAKLWLVPFEAMTLPPPAQKVPSSGGGGQPSEQPGRLLAPYVINRHRVFYVFSGRELMGDKRAHPQNETKRVLVVNVPRFDGRQAETQAVPPRPLRPVALREANRAPTVLSADAVVRTEPTSPVATGFLAGGVERVPMTLRSSTFLTAWRPPGRGYQGRALRQRVFYGSPPPCCSHSNVLLPSQKDCRCNPANRNASPSAILGCQLNNGFLKFIDDPKFGNLNKMVREAIKDQRELKLDSTDPNEGKLISLFGKPTGASPDVLVFTTHGCYLNDSAEIPDSKKLAHSLLALDGANLPEKNDKAAIAVEINGILNGQEVVQHFNLDGTRLTMLIGCETGKGAVDGDSVAALRHAFTMAMADRGSVVATSWTVELPAAKEWMETFSKGYFSSQSVQRGHPLDSMRSAAIKVQQKAEWHHPLFWAPFLLTGNPVSTE